MYIYSLWKYVRMTRNIVVMVKNSVIMLDFITIKLLAEYTITLNTRITINEKRFMQTIKFEAR